MRKKFTQNFSRSSIALKLAVIVLLLSFINAFEARAQTPGKVTGTVKDAGGMGLPGVSVKVNGAVTAAVTDANGKYSISAKVGATLTFSFIGFTTTEKVVPANKVLDVVLAETSSSLSEVVVTGFGGKVKRSDLTAPVSSVSAKDIQDRQPINLLEALQGKAAGVLITNDGGPGAEGTIQIRGVTTLNAGAGPLYVVDGVISDNGRNINPLDIASIEVLKDAASASIYGVQAANGVILITTKKGVEGVPQVSVQYTHLFGRLAHKLPQSNAQEVRAFRRLQAGGTATAGSSTDSLNPSFNADNDLQKLLLGNLGNRDQVNLSLSGASKTLNYYTSVNYMDDKSIIINSYAKTLQTRLNISYQPTTFLKYTTNLTLYYQNKNEIPVGRTVNVVFDRPAFSLIYYPDGSLTSYIGSKRNPVANALYEINKTETYSAQVNNQLDLNISKHLKWTNLFNFSYESPQYTFFSPRYLSNGRTNNNGTDELKKNFNYEIQSYLNYSQTFNKYHNFSATLGIDAQKRSSDIFHLEYANTTSEEITAALPAYLTTTSTYTGGSGSTQQSFLARLNYDYKSKYIFQGVLRNDGSSKFGESNQRGYFYSGSGAWRFSAEKFMDWSKNYLDDAKLRVSYGRVGNDQITNYASLTKVSFTGSYNGVGAAVYDSNFGNSDIHYETNVQTNLGLELTFLKGRLSVTADVYKKGSEGLLYPQELAKETGFSTVTVNVGSINTKGLELTVSGVPISKKNFTWNIDANISFERGVVTELAGHTPFVAGSKWYVQEGGRLGDFYGWTNLGVFQWNESNAYNDSWKRLTVVLGGDGKPLFVGGKPQYTYDGQPYTGTVHNLYDPAGKLKGGDTEWQNMNADSLIDDNDRHVIGNSQPKFYLGVSNNFTYKNFSLFFLVNTSIGGQIYNTLQYNANYPSNTGPGNPMVLYNSWQKQGDIATLPYYPDRASRGSLKQNGNSLYLEDASFIRLASVRLSYNLNNKFAAKLHLKGLSGFIYGTNLMTWTNYTGYDPEFSTSNPLTPNDDTGKYPKRREVGLGINIKL
ncbi:MAG: SusC/RagA family TonB-linked outer membrane protein [Mucilaginibacter sp.]|uniref:SusC/RagA family TonB-linked outer membrane protein n=1 Tax=Mucilaginibacter sp. TaxID=1882438 RepID=UPI0032659B85